MNTLVIARNTMGDALRKRVLLVFLLIAVVMLFPAGVGWLCSLATLNALVQLSSPRWVNAPVPPEQRCSAPAELSHLVLRIP